MDHLVPVFLRVGPQKYAKYSSIAVAHTHRYYPNTAKKKFIYNSNHNLVKYALFSSIIKALTETSTEYIFSGFATKKMAPSDDLESSR